jgi:protein-S-isoprenylcysteine O-methyltransferase Ste14
MDLEMLKKQWDRVAAWVAAAAGLVLLIVGYFGVSSSPYPAEQIPYIVSSGIGALFLLGAAATLWVSADLRDEWSKLDEIRQLLATQVESGQMDAEYRSIAASATPKRRSRAAGADS